MIKYLFYSGPYTYAEWILPIYYKLDEPKLYITNCEYTRKEIESRNMPCSDIPNNEYIKSIYENNNIECTVFGDEDMSQYIYQYVILKKARSLCLGHGFNFYERNRIEQKVDWNSYCYNNENINWLIDKGLSPDKFILTGSAKHDILYDKQWLHENRIEKLYKQYNVIDKTKEMILLAPHTFGEIITKENSYELLFAALSKTGYNVFIKLHPSEYYGEQIIKLKDLCKKHSNIYIADDPGILKFMVAASCYVGNKSSSIFEFLFFEKPIVLIGDHKTYLGDNEPFRRINLNEITNICNVIEEEKNNSFRKNILKFYKDQYFTTKDGNASERYIDIIKKIGKSK